jgi:hypothetical protein
VRIIVITIEGVLSETDDLLSSPPTKEGRDLYNALKGPYRVILFSNGDDHAVAKEWLKKEGFKGYAMLLCYPLAALALTGWKISQVRMMLGDGWDIAMVIDTDRQVHQAMLDEGVASVLVSYPGMARPGRLPESPGPLRPWDEIAATVEERNMLQQGG